MNIVSDSARVGFQAGEAKWEASGTSQSHVGFVSPAWFEDPVWLDEGARIQAYGPGQGPTTAAVAISKWTFKIKVAVIKDWMHTDQEVEIGSARMGNLEWHRIASVSNDTITIATQLAYDHVLGEVVSLSRTRGLYPTSAFYPSGRLLIGVPQNRYEVDANGVQIIEQSPHVMYSSYASSLIQSMVYRGGNVTARSPASMFVTVASGQGHTISTNVHGDSVGYDFSGALQDSIAIATANPTNPRIDVVYWDSAGVARVATGTPAASPSAPSTPAKGIKLAQISVAAAATSISSGNISDSRVRDMRFNPGSGQIGVNGTPFANLHVYGNGIYTSQSSNGNLKLQGHSSTAKFPYFGFTDENGTVKAKAVTDLSAGSYTIDYSGAGSSGAGTFNVRNGIDGSNVFQLAADGTGRMYGNLTLDGRTTASQTTAATSGNSALLTSGYTADPSGASTASTRALNLTSAVQTANAQNITGDIRGIDLRLNHNGTGTLSGGYGVLCIPSNTSTGTFSTIYSIYSRIDNTNASGTIGTAYGLYIAAFNRTGTISTSYGVYVADATANNYFAGNVGIGDDSPASPLTVGNGDLFQVDANGRVPKFDGVTTERAGLVALGDTVERGGQTAAIGATNFNNTAGYKAFRVSGYVQTTTASGSGTPTLTVTYSYTDDVGATTQTPTTTHSLSATGRTVLNPTVIYVASGTPTWATSITGASGSPVYKLVLILERLY